jgi:RHS repeat-associated protein
MSLFQPEQNRAITCTLLAVDRQRSPLHAFTETQQQPQAFTAYGTCNPQDPPVTALGFTGERRITSTGHYLLGNGYRAFNPALMRFNSPDVLSPFGDGGINSYGYCGGDPVNRVDPTGTTPIWAKRFLRRLGLMAPPPIPRVDHLAPVLQLPVRARQPPAANPAPGSPTSQVSAASTLPVSRQSPTGSANLSFNSGPNWMGSTGTLPGSPAPQWRVTDVDGHLRAMRMNRQYHGETPENAFEPPPSYCPAPPYRSLKPPQPGPPPPYKEVDRIRKPRTN